MVARMSIAGYLVLAESAGWEVARTRARAKLWDKERRERGRQNVQQLFRDFADKFSAMSVVAEVATRRAQKPSSQSDEEKD